jgi:hypothetical protein
MSNKSQWNPPEDQDEYIAWVKEFHKKWLKDSDIKTLKNIIITSDGLGAKSQRIALDLLINKMR